MQDRFLAASRQLDYHSLVYIRYILGFCGFLVTKMEAVVVDVVQLQQRFVLA